MWPQEEQDQDSSSQSKHNRVVSSSSSSSRSPFSSNGPPQTPRRAMDEVWKDITLNPTTPIFDTCDRQPFYHRHAGDVIHVGPTTAAAAASTTLSHFRGMILQDFLARPFRGATPTLSAAAEKPCHRGGNVGLFGSALTLPPRPSPPATVLCLNSGVDFQCMGSSRPGLSEMWSQDHSTTGDHRRLSSSSTAAAAVAFPDSAGAGFFSFGNNKRRNTEQQQQPESSNCSGNDHRHKRMIKNRESAARSRARKQAYTNELELEVNNLTEENQRLRRQHEELRARLAAQLLPTRKPLQRSSTAPF